MGARMKPGDMSKMLSGNPAPSRNRAGRNRTSDEAAEISLRRLREIFQYLPVCIWEEDFSEVKRSLDLLRRRGIQNFRKYFDEHPQEILSFAGKVKITDVNDYTLELYQAATKEDLLRGLGIIFSKKSYDAFKEELTALAEGETRFISEAVNLTLKGEERHILLSLTVPPGYEESLSRVIVCTTDISAVQRRLQDLEQSEEKHRKIFETAFDAMFIADTGTGIILEANESAGRLLGLPPDRIVGMHFTELYPEEERETYRKLFQRHVAQGQSLSRNLQLCHTSGRTVPVSVTSSVITVGGRKYLAGIFREIRQGEQEIGIASPSTLPKATGDLPSHVRQSLSQRERQVLAMIARGMTNKQIAETLHISEKTVGTHRTRLMYKLDLHKTADLVRYAIASGILG